MVSLLLRCFVVANLFSRGCTYVAQHRLAKRVVSLGVNNLEEGEDVKSSSRQNAPSVEELLGRARRLRQEIERTEATTRKRSKGSNSTFEERSVAASNTQSPWSLRNTSSDATTYRFYVDIGREEGTWMDSRWGASGARIELSLDVAFTTERANRTVEDLMVRDNRGGSSSPTFTLDCAPYARLRGGFDRMKCEAGAYRVDSDARQKTLRLFFRAEGKTYGDVSIPENSNLYISLPILPDSSLSRKEGIVSVRQFGWHTGWYREESRIVGVVMVLPHDEARRKGGF